MRKHCPTIVSLFGFVIAIFGYIISWYILPRAQEKFAMSTNLIENTPFFNTWQKTPFPMKFKVYFFHVLNPDEVQNGAKPRLLEKGPYVYDDYHEKTNVKINEEEDTVEYFKRRHFVFNQNDSGCRSDEDEITIINPTVMATALQIEQMMPSFLPLINDALPHLFPGIKDAFLRTKVKDMLFDGVRISCKNPEVSMACGGIKSRRPPSIREIPNDPDLLVSTLTHLNGTEDGPYLVGRGMKNTTKGQFLKYKNEEHVSVWAGETCNRINGTDLSINPPLPIPIPSLYVFTMELCRSLRLDFERPSMLNGLVTLRYSAPMDMFHPTKENECFCPVVMNDEDEDVIQCLKAGLFDMTPCLKGVMYISSPHFLYGDPELLSFASKLNPDREKHGIFVEMEPGTGMSVAGAMRIQFNLPTKRMEDILFLQNISEGMFPIMWTESSYELPSAFLENIKAGYDTLSLLYKLKYALLTIGFIIMLAAIIAIAYCERLWCFDKCGRKVTFATNDNERRSNIATISVDNQVPRMVDDIGSMRKNGFVNLWQFKN